MPAHPIPLQLLEQLDFPVAAPSANPFGYVSPTRPRHVQRTLGTEIAAILDGGHLQPWARIHRDRPTRSEQPRLLRPGPIDLVQLEQIAGAKFLVGPSQTDDTKAQSGPGLLTKHYSPTTPITLLENGSAVTQHKAKHALILNRRPTDRAGPDTYWLSESGNLTEIGQTFSTLYKGSINTNIPNYSSKSPQQRAGAAINDRLKRATASSNTPTALPERDFIARKKPKQCKQKRLGEIRRPAPSRNELVWKKVS